MAAASVLLPAKRGVAAAAHRCVQPPLRPDRTAAGQKPPDCPCLAWPRRSQSVRKGRQVRPHSTLGGDLPAQSAWACLARRSPRQKHAPNRHGSAAARRCAVQPHRAKRTACLSRPADNTSVAQSRRRGSRSLMIKTSKDLSVTFSQQRPLGPCQSWLVASVERTHAETPETAAFFTPSRNFAPLPPPPACTSPG